MKATHIIVAHPKQDSFNMAMVATARKALHNKNKTPLETDVYQLAKENSNVTGVYGLTRGNDLSIAHEQEKFKTSELTILQFPLYWFGMPGVLKNYIDQLFQPGFAYEPGKFDTSPLADGRKLLISVTTQSTREDFSETGANGPIDKILHPIHIAFRFAGYKILPPFVAYNIADKSAYERKAVLVEYSRYIQSI